MTRIFVPLASEPFLRFHAGTKTVEVRSRTSPVARQVLRAAPGTPVVLRKGYSSGVEIWGRLGVVWLAESLAALPSEALEGADLREMCSSGFFDAGKPVVAFSVLPAAELDGGRIPLPANPWLGVGV